MSKGNELPSLHHVQLAMPPGGEARAQEFYGGILGLQQVPKPPELAKRGGCWFVAGGLRLHLGIEPDFRPATKAHPGLLFADIAPLIERLRLAGYEPRFDEGYPGYSRAYTHDPFGNRIEVMQASGR